LERKNLLVPRTLRSDGLVRQRGLVLGALLFIEAPSGTLEQSMDVDGQDNVRARVRAVLEHNAGFRRGVMLMWRGEQVP